MKYIFNIKIVTCIGLPNIIEIKLLIVTFNNYIVRDDTFFIRTGVISHFLSLIGSFVLYKECYSQIIKDFSAKNITPDRDSSLRVNELNPN